MSGRVDVPMSMGYHSNPSKMLRYELGLRQQRRKERDRLAVYLRSRSRQGLGTNWP